MRLVIILLTRLSEFSSSYLMLAFNCTGFQCVSNVKFTEEVKIIRLTDADVSLLIEKNKIQIQGMLYAFAHYYMG